MIFGGVFEVRLEADDELHNPRPLSAHGDDVRLVLLDAQAAHVRDPQRADRPRMVRVHAER